MVLQKLEKLLVLIEQSKSVLIVSHAKPDADTLGTAIALGLWLENLGRGVKLACKDRPSKDFSFMPGVESFVQSFELNDYDLMIVVDCGARHLTEFDKSYANFFNTLPIVNIDHHASNDDFGDLNIVDPKAASTTVMVYDIFKELGVPISSSVATALLAGIYGDTGGFMHSNTSAKVLKIASELMSAGADVSSISASLFKTKSVRALKLWGKALENISVSDDVVMSVLEESDYKETGADPNQLTGLVDYLNMVPGSKFSVLINEDRQGFVKGSFRTRNEDVDLSEIASQFGGGGHPKAAGFKIPGRLRGDTRFEIVENEGASVKKLKF